MSVYNRKRERDDYDRCARVGGNNWWDASRGNTLDAKHVFNPHEKYSSQTQKKTNCLLLLKPAKASFPPAFCIQKGNINLSAARSVNYCRVNNI